MTEQEQRETEKNQYFESAARRKKAELEARPHMMYGARVWKTALTEEHRQWACGLVSDGWLPHCGTVQIGPAPPLPVFGASAYPVAMGKTPALACEAFDHLWYDGFEDHNWLPDKQCKHCGARVYHRDGNGSGLIVCEHGHTSEVL